MNKSAFFLGLIIILGLNSCTSVLDFQTARTLGTGNNELIVAGTFINPETEEDHTTPYISPSIEFKRGIHEKLDMGVQVQPFSSAVITYKYQFVGDVTSKFAFAATNKLGYDYTVSDDLTIGDLDGYNASFYNLDFLDDEFEFTIENFNNLTLNYAVWHTELGLVGSYHINKELAVSSAIKAIFLFNSDGQAYTYANTYGVEIGKKTKFSINVGYNFAWFAASKQDGFRAGPLQYGLGIKKPITFGAKKEEKKTLN